MRDGFGLPFVPAVLLLALLPAVWPAATLARGQKGGWVEVDYGELVDRRRLSHSGEPVGDLLRGLAQRKGAPERYLSLLDPLLEPYAFLLQDTLDAIAGISDPPLVDIGGLWQPGQEQPAWVELARARRFLIESDGRGRMRILLPVGASDPSLDAVEAARRGYDAAWPVLRHVFKAERRRLAAGGAGEDEPPIDVEIHAYLHSIEQTRFRLGTRPYEARVEETRGDGRRPPLDLAGIRLFLESGLEVEGARLDAAGNLRLIGSRPSSRPTVLGQPLDLAEFAVAYRAVFHGGRAEPYMSLDRGPSPQTSIVNYGGRLRDTTLGMISLLCDVRFKTFSLGLDVATGEDLRERIREALPEFRTHYERFAADPSSGSVLDQQTRMWFYPDKVDLTISTQGDLLAMRRVRMSAASERLELGSDGAPAAATPPWTRDTVDAVNRDYDALARIFPELGDLDRLVRMLSLFTWLRQAELEGLPIPELDTLLALPLPQRYTPRRFPQLLSYNVLPRGEGAVEVFDRLPIGEALERVGSAARGQLPARRRFLRARAMLDPSHPRSAALLEQLGGIDVESIGETDLDLLTYRAERVRMHQTILSTLDPGPGRRLVERQQRETDLRFFSIGIGGLDLDMTEVVARGRGRSLGLGAGNGTSLGESRGPAAMPGEPAGDGEPREAWRVDPTMPATTMPEHGWPRGQPGEGSFGSSGFRIERGSSGRGGKWLWTVFGVDSPEVRSRKVFMGKGSRVEIVERVDVAGFQRYRMVNEETVWRAARLDDPAAAPGAAVTTAPTSGLVVLELLPPADPVAPETAEVKLRLRAMAGGAPRRLETVFPRRVLQRLLLGPQADLTPGVPLPGFSPLPAGLEAFETLMVALNAEQKAAPWESGRIAVAGEEDPLRIAQALNAWWAGRAGATDAAPAHSVVVGCDPVASPARWASAPRTGGPATLLLPREAFQGDAASRRAPIAAAWQRGDVVDELPDEQDTDLVVLISDEPPALFAARVRALAGNPALDGKLLAAWSLAGPMRQDLPASLLAAGRLAGFGLAGAGVVSQRAIDDQVAAWDQGLGEQGKRVERVPGPFLWYF